MWRYRLSDIELGPEAEEAVAGVIRSGWLSCGPVTARFEQEMARFLGVPGAVAVSSCTAALHLALRCLGIGPGDEVVVPSLTFVATANSVLYAGATPVFADVESDARLTLDPRDVRARLTPRTRAVVVMHYGGHACDMQPILELAAERGLRVIEDAAHAVGAAWQGRPLGTVGDVGCFSFFANKNLPAGEGGLLVAGDQALVERARRLRSHAMTTVTWDRERGHAFTYDVDDLGYNYRMTEVQAALARVQLARLEANNASRGRLARRYRQQLQDCPFLSVPFAGANGESAHHIFPVLLRPGSDRQACMQRLKQAGIQSSIHYPPVHQFTFYRNLPGRPPDRLPRTEDAAARLVTLPLHPRLSERDVDVICGEVRAFVEQQEPAGV